MKRALGRLMVLALFLFGPLADGLRAQTLITFDSCYQFIESSWQTLNEQLYHKAIAGEIKAYTNDSLASVYSIPELKERGSLETVSQIQYSDDVYDIIDTTVVTLFDPSTDFSGLSLHYSLQSDPESFTTSYSLWSYAPLFELTVAGVELGSIPLFHVPRQTVLESMPSSDVELYQSLFIQRSLHGDFTNPYYKDDFDPDGMAYEGLSYHLFGAHPFQHCTRQSDSIMASYNLQLFSALANKHALNGGKLYKDTRLKKAHDPDFSDLDQEFVITTPEASDEDAFFSFIDTSIIVEFSFNGFYDTEILRSEDNFIISLIVRDVDRSEIGRVCYSYNALNKYLQKSDEVVLTHMLNSWTD
ncbi:MAG: hypothetical protein H6608_05855 [Flavobacteriales bacterium]|nr:hypothetical protein [Flavobacteriales bacterium]